MANYVLVTQYTSGDVMPFIKMGALLRDHGHDVTICTHCIYEEQVLGKGMNFASLDLPEQFNDMIRDLPLLADPVNEKESSLRFNTLYHGKDQLLHDYEAIVKYCNRKDTVLVVRHRSCISGILIAEKLNLPIATVILAPNYLAHMNIHQSIMGEEIVTEINKARKVLGLKEISNWTDWMCSPGKILALWPEWFAAKEGSWPEQLETLGFPICIEQEPNISELFEESIEEYLNSGKKVVLITGGSSRILKPEFNIVATEACGSRDFVGILVAPHDELVPKKLPENVIRVRYTNLKSLMNRVDVIIHHGGMGSLSEAMMVGIPQVILPYMIDRPDNAFRAQHLGVAESFPPLRWDVEKIAQILDKMIAGKYEDSCRIVMGKMKEKNLSKNILESLEEMILCKDFLMPNIENIKPIYINPVCTVTKKSVKLAAMDDKKKRELLKVLMKQKLTVK